MAKGRRSIASKTLVVANEWPNDGFGPVIRPEEFAQLKIHKDTAIIKGKGKMDSIFDEPYPASLVPQFDSSSSMPFVGLCHNPLLISFLGKK